MTSEAFIEEDDREGIFEVIDYAVSQRGPEEFRVAIEMRNIGQYCGALTHDEFHKFLAWIRLWQELPPLILMDPMTTFSFIVPDPEDDKN